MEVGRFSPTTYGRDIKVSPQIRKTLYAALSVAAASKDGAVYRSTDKGTTWQRFDKVQVHGTIMSVALHQTDPKQVYLGARYDGEIYGTEDGGDDLGFVAAAVRREGHLFAGGGIVTPTNSRARNNTYPVMAIPAWIAITTALRRSNSNRTPVTIAPMNSTAAIVPNDPTPAWIPSPDPATRKATRPTQQRQQHRVQYQRRAVVAPEVPSPAGAIAPTHFPPRPPASRPRPPAKPIATPPRPDRASRATSSAVYPPRAAPLRCAARPTVRVLRATLSTAVDLERRQHRQALSILKRHQRTGVAHLRIVHAPRPPWRRCRT